MARMLKLLKTETFVPREVPHFCDYAQFHEEMIELIDALAKQNVPQSELVERARTMAKDHEGSFYGGHRAQFAPPRARLDESF